MEKNKRLEIRISALDKALIKIEAKELNLSMSDYIVKCCLRRKLPKPLTEKELEAWSELKKLSCDLTRAGNYIKKNDAEFYKRTREVVYKIENELNKIIND